MKKPIINLEEVELQPRHAAFAAKGKTAERYDAKMGAVAPLIGAQKLGYNITSVPAGKCAFPFHNHHVNEEMFLILAGSGEVRFGDDTYPIKTMDIIACPPGDEKVAHQIKNTGNTALKYLAVSTKLSPEIAEYPDSGKFGVRAEYPSDSDGKPQGLRYVGRKNESIDYWDGE